MSVNVDRSLALPDSEYFAEPQAKSGIALHHTVCDDAHTTVRLWRADKTADGTPHHVGAAYASHQDLTRRYIAELNKPRIRLPSIVGFVAAAGVGFVVGRVVP
jgi:hypothetical protein